MLQRVPPEDEREGLRGQQCLVACRAFAAGDVILPYQVRGRTPAPAATSSYGLHCLPLLSTTRTGQANVP